MENKLTSIDPNQPVEIRLGTRGTAAYPPQTVVDVFKSTVQRHGNRPALAQKKKVNGEIPRDWKIWTWQQYWNDCVAFAKTLVHLNTSLHDIINIIGFNSPEWLIANNGAILAGGIAAGIYTTNGSESCMYIGNHSKAKVIVVEDNTQLKKFVPKHPDDLKFCKAIVVYGENPDADFAAANFKFPVYSWSDFLQLGASVPTEQVESRFNNVSAGYCATLIYTSGTTGPPKAVMISHDNITWTSRVLMESYVDVNHTDRVVSYLPLSHIAAQMIDVHCPMFLGAATYFAQPDALKGSLANSMKEVRPTIFFGVPRVWEKIEEKMVQVGRESTGLKKTLGTWAKAVGAEHSRLQQFGNGGGAPWGYGCMNSLILSKIKEALGLDQAKACFSAAAPIAVTTINYFASLDIPIYEVFGQSECTGPHTVSAPGQWKVGYCGRPMPGTESKIDANTQELCYRGRHIFMGYMYMPDDTAATIDREGYLHSGDCADFDEHNLADVPPPSGFMKITGRIKELIITAGGENIPPVLIETEMKNAMPALSNCIVVGDQKKFLTMLVSLKTEVDAETGEPTDILSKDSLFVGASIGSTARTQSEAAVDPLWIKYINDGMKIGNSKKTSNAQVIQKWKMLPLDLSEKAGELTPTLKIKRKVVTTKYADLIESMYHGHQDS